VWQFDATVYPADANDKSVTWSSNDPSIVEISQDGLVEGISQGLTTVSVTTNSEGRTANANVIVRKPITVITPSSTSVYIEAGSSDTVAYIIYPDDAYYANELQVTTNDSDVATAVKKEGSREVIISCNEPGDAIITLKTVKDVYSTDIFVHSIRYPTHAIVATDTASLTFGDYINLEAWVFPFDSTNKNIDIEVSTDTFLIVGKSYNQSKQKWDLTLTGIATGVTLLTISPEELTKNPATATCLVDVY